MKENVQHGLAAVFALCALTIAGTAVHREFAPAAPPRKTGNAVKYVKNWEALGQQGQVIGADTAVLKLVEFSDFQCPFCREAQHMLDEFRDHYKGRVAIVYHHYPIPELHPSAYEAAIASECAASQGRFTAYHDVLFANPDSVRLARWTSLAKTADVKNLSVFDVCVKSQQFKARIDDDIRRGKDAGVAGTPTFIFRGRMVGVPGLALIKTWLDSTLVH
jgi:protein-disulfide isomerase